MPAPVMAMRYMCWCFSAASLKSRWRSARCGESRAQGLAHPKTCPPRGALCGGGRPLSCLRLAAAPRLWGNGPKGRGHPQGMGTSPRDRDLHRGQGPPAVTGAASGDLPEGQGPLLETGMSPRGEDIPKGQGFGSRHGARGVWRRGAHALPGVPHAPHEGGRLGGAGAHGLRPALAEEPRHGGLVGEAEAALVLRREAAGSGHGGGGRPPGPPRASPRRSSRGSGRAAGRSG